MLALTISRCLMGVERMKTITLTAWKRPEHLREVVESLRRNNTAGYSLIAVLDAGFDPVCYKILHGIGFMPKHLEVLGVHHGVNFAGKHALETALKFGSDLNVAVEDDTVLAPDCLDLVDAWHRARRLGVLNCFSFSRDFQEPATVSGDGEFNAWVWAAHAGAIRFLLENWCSHHEGWDDSIRNLFRKHGIKTYQPRLSRVKNIGPTGAHYTPALHEKHFGGCVMSDGEFRNYVFA